MVKEVLEWSDPRNVIGASSVDFKSYRATLRFRIDGSNSFQTLPEETLDVREANFVLQSDLTPHRNRDHYGTGFVCRLFGIGVKYSISESICFCIMHRQKDLSRRNRRSHDRSRQQRTST